MGLWAHDLTDLSEQWGPQLRALTGLSEKCGPCGELPGCASTHVISRAPRITPDAGLSAILIFKGGIEAGAQGLPTLALKTCFSVSCQASRPLTVRSLSGARPLILMRPAASFPSGSAEKEGRPFPITLINHPNCY